MKKHFVVRPVLSAQKQITAKKNKEVDFDEIEEMFRKRRFDADQIDIIMSGVKRGLDPKYIIQYVKRPDLLDDDALDYVVNGLLLGFTDLQLKSIADPNKSNEQRDNLFAEGTKQKGSKPGRYNR